MRGVTKYRLRLTDTPDARKQHAAPVPLIGGITIFIGLLVGMLIAQPLVPGLWTLLLAGGLVVLMGVFDDAIGLGVRWRMPVQILASLLVASAGGIMLKDLGFVLGNGSLLVLGNWAIPFTVFAIVGAINALNMIDGADGLAGSMSVVTLTGMGVLAYTAGLGGVVELISIYLALIGVFLSYNLGLWGQKRKIFLGDAGSMFLGFSIAWFSIYLSQESTRALSPVVCLWLFSVPLFDTVTVMLRRIANKKSPFHADRSHLHHILQKLGCSHKQVLAIMVSMACLMATVGVLGYILQVPEALLFYGFLGLFGCHLSLSTWALRLPPKKQHLVEF